MPSTTRIAGRVHSAASDEHMEMIATKVIDHDGLVIGFTTEEHETKEQAFKAARSYQARFGIFRSRARKRVFEMEKKKGYDVNVLGYQGPYDSIECQVRETPKGYEVRLVLSKNLYKQLTITDLGGNPIPLD